jgi:hypothetical protein
MHDTVIDRDVVHYPEARAAEHLHEALQRFTLGDAMRQGELSGDAGDCRDVIRYHPASWLYQGLERVDQIAGRRVEKGADVDDVRLARVIAMNS